MHLLRCRFASPFLCLIAKSGLEESREVKALPSCTPRPQKARRDTRRAHRPSSDKLPWTPTLARSQDDARARLGDSLARRARAMVFGGGGVTYSTGTVGAGGGSGGGGGGGTGAAGSGVRLCGGGSWPSFSCSDSTAMGYSWGWGGGLVPLGA